MPAAKGALVTMARPRKFPYELLALVNAIYERDKVSACVCGTPHRVTVGAIAKRFSLPARALWSYRCNPRAILRKKIICSRPNGVPEKEVNTQGVTVVKKAASGRRKTEAEPTGAALQS